ncbi:response regulator [Vibrio sp. SM6]|uniref:histidine kinase n=1 Tax=Vibrio agarilyticus TaxID=2726741 RepID=A0A7X8TTU0_9VIBR|nr:ATP-binding protein [Vibrio agarilyticus]NLS14417.1 response regulator [Vibrio agarilyticus]
MDRTRLLFSISALLCLSIIAAMTLLYAEYKRISEYRAMVTEVGHEVIEIRDAVTLYEISTQTDPYHLTRTLVALEHQAQAIMQEFEARQNIGLYKMETFIQLDLFTKSLIKITDALDNVIGIIIVKESLLESVSHQLNVLNTNDNSAARALLIDGIEFFVDESSEFGASIQTFQRVEQQKQRLFTLLLSHENMAFVENSEKAMTELASHVRNNMIQLLFAFILVVSVTIVITYLMRVSELKRNNASYQEAIERTERANQAKSLFLATMSHELRTPMNGVLGLAQIIQEDAKEPQIQEHAAMIMTSGQHLVTLLNDILDFSKVEQGKMVLECKSFALSDILIPLQNSLTPLAKEKGIRFEICNQLDERARLIGDASRLRQVLFNLAGNAIKFTTEGNVKVAVEPLSHHETQRELHQGIKIVVSDTGIGIEKDKLTGIFTPFEQAELSTTRRFGGTGLGLSIVKQITELMGGTITVFSQPGIGSQFTLTLPIAMEMFETRPTKAEQPFNQALELSTPKEVNTPIPNHTLPIAAERNTTPQTPIALAQNALSVKTASIDILLVDDNRVNAAVAERFLHSLGHNITLATDGHQALTILNERRFNLIIMDNHMPNLGGIETIRRLRQELNISTVVFAYTADVFQQAHDEFLQAGANFVLTKPLQKVSLENAIAQFIDQITDTDSFARANNVVPLVRYPVTQLPMTEEEISSSSLLNDEEMSFEETVDLLRSLQSEFDEKTDAFFSAYTEEDANALYRVLHSIKGTALEFGMREMVRLTQHIEQEAYSGDIPNVETLQKLINRMLVNSHQAQRVIHKLNQQRETG